MEEEDKNVRHNFQFGTIRPVQFTNNISTATCATNNLEGTAHCVAKFGYFIVSLIALDCSASHNKITRKHCYNVPVSVDSFGVNTSSILNKYFQDERCKITIRIC